MSNNSNEQNILDVRRQKLNTLRENKVEPFAEKFSDRDNIADILTEHSGLEADVLTDRVVSVAGRIKARRGQGKMMFFDLVDRTGTIQLVARFNILEENSFSMLKSEIDLADIIGVRGIVFTTVSGQLSIEINEVHLLTKALRPMPDKHAGLSDVETKYRRRELDLMSNEESRQLFITRSKVISSIRRQLENDGFLEVETPILQELYGGANAKPFITRHNALDRDLYMRIAPELYLKRLLVGGLERVFEIGRNFRNEGLSPKHNPEFTALEWYEAYADYEEGAARMETIISNAAKSIEYEGELNFTVPWHRVNFVDAIYEATGIDLMSHVGNAEVDALTALERQLEANEEVSSRLGDISGMTWPQIADSLFSIYVEPTLIQPTFVYDYPIELSPLANAHPDKPGLAMRWEAFAGGMEIANAFSELTDPDEQRQRFEEQNRYAAEGDDEAQPYDENFIMALEQGMPPATGVGIGLDRLVMVMTGTTTIRDVVLFPAMRQQAT